MNWLRSLHRIKSYKYIIKQATLTMTQAHLGFYTVNQKRLLRDQTGAFFGNKAGCCVSGAPNLPGYKHKHILLIVIHAGTGNITLWGRGRGDCLKMNAALSRNFGDHRAKQKDLKHP